MVLDYPAFGQVQVSNELKNRRILVLGREVRSIWQRHKLETVKKRFKFLEEKAAKEGLVYIKEQVRVRETLRREKKEGLKELETDDPAYLIARDAYYVGYIKGEGWIYQAAFDTYSSVAFSKIQTAKVSVTAADMLNDLVLPLFEDQEVSVLRVLTDSGIHYCGSPDNCLY